ncbi:MAG: InlB B-repeat-containing protein [Lachnospiraceae bacterium]|nr:InlB B-repeat-containing protein [Lachnospiraceae bacterium]
MKRNKLILRGFILSAFLLAALVGVLSAGRRAAAEEYPDVPRYTITYNANGGEFAPETQYKYKDIPLTLSEQVPLRAGYSFVGWSTTVHPEIIYPAGAEYTANYGARFYAIWQVSEFTITFNANGGEIAPPDMKKRRGIPLTLPVWTPFRDGYTFLGWSTTTEPSVRYQAGDTYTNDYGAKFYAIWKKDEDPSGLHEIIFSGSREDCLFTDRYCYAVGDRVVLLLDKGLYLPGDILEKIDLIMECLEEKTGLSFVGSFSPDLYDESLFEDYCGSDNPWDGIEFEGKLAIYIVKRSSSSHTDHYAGRIYLGAMNYYADGGGTPLGYFDYTTLAHELTHVLTMGYTHVNFCVTEGSAEYVSRTLMEELCENSEDFYMSYENSKYPPHIPNSITPDNAEEAFLCDCSCFGGNGGYPEYYWIGRDLCEFLNETYGSGFLCDYITAVTDAGINAKYGFFTEEDYVAFTALFKETFGDDVFVRFGEWYQENIAR